MANTDGRWIKLAGKMSEEQIRAYAGEWITKMNKTVYGVYWLG